MNKQDQFIDLKTEKRIDDLLQKMTIEEKFGQLTQYGPSLVGGFQVTFEELIAQLVTGRITKEEFEAQKDSFKEDLHEDKIRKGTVGSLLGTFGRDKINRVQKIAVEESRLGIPILNCVDVIHGFRTVFPIPLAESCTWEPELLEKSAAVAAKEAASEAVHLTFAPMLDIARDARWGRISEGNGEDPYLGSRIAAAKVRGYQGDDLKRGDSVLACAKHFMGYGAAEGGRDYNTVQMSMPVLRDIYLPPFKAALDAGVATVMSAFNDLNGIPCSVNRFLLSDLLRGELNFKGFVISDANSVGECIDHGVAADKKEAGALALRAGLDIDMATGSFELEGQNMLRDGLITQEEVDEAVRRVLRIKFAKGLFDNPYAKEQDVQLLPEHIALAREVSRRSIVLLKNDGCLPLSKTIQTLAVIGPYADEATDMMGAWAFTGKDKDVVTALAGIRSHVSSGTTVSYHKGCEPDGQVYDEAIEMAAGAEIIIAVVGEGSAMSGEASSMADISLSTGQQALLEKLKALGKPLVVLLQNGRPMAIPWVEANASALVEVWQLGIQGGEAVGDVLFGDYNPSGKLTVTFPHHSGQLPIYYNHPSTGRPGSVSKFTSKYMDMPLGPLFPFGYGLSYTTFAYRDLSLAKTVLAQEDRLEVSVMVKNTGDRFGEEVVQLYLRDLTASLVRPVKELKGFAKTALAPGEEKQIHFTIPVAEMGFHDQNGSYIVEPGRFKVFAGTSSADVLEADFEVVQS